MCQLARCPAYPQATCFSDPCRMCHVEFRDEQGNVVNCTKGLLNFVPHSNLINQFPCWFHTISPFGEVETPIESVKGDCQILVIYILALMLLRVLQKKETKMKYLSEWFYKCIPLRWKWIGATHAKWDHCDDEGKWTQQGSTCRNQHVDHKINAEEW